MTTLDLNHPAGEAIARLNADIARAANAKDGATLRAILATFPATFAKVMDATGCKLEVWTLRPPITDQRRELIERRAMGLEGSVFPICLPHPEATEKATPDTAIENCVIIESGGFGLEQRIAAAMAGVERVDVAVWR